MSTQDLAALCREYHLVMSDKDNKFIEVEIRLNDIDLNLFQQIYQSMMDKKVKVERDHSVNTIINERGDRSIMMSKIRRTDLLKKEEEYSSKKNLRPPLVVRPKNNTPYKISVSVERPIDQFHGIDPNKAIIRIKNRLSFDFEPGWRLDMTIVRSPSTSINNLRKLVYDVCPPDQTPDKFLDTITTPELFKYEVELEYVGKSENLTPEMIQAAVQKILLLINPQYAEHAEIQGEVFFAARNIVQTSDRLAKFEHTYGLKQLLPSVRGLTRVEYYRDIYPPINYHITDKAHGVRALVIIREHKLSLLSEKLKKVEDDSKNYQTEDVTIIDGELLDGNRFLAFDVIMIRGETIDGGFGQRVKRLEEAVEIVKFFPEISATVKTYVHLMSDDPKMLSQQFNEILKGKDYETDGIIMVPPDTPYANTIALKWKPMEEITNDFLARRPPADVMGASPFVDGDGRKLHFLFTTVSVGMMSRLNLTKCPGYSTLFPDLSFRAETLPIQFQPASSQYAYLYWHDETTYGPIDGKIVELGCGEGCFSNIFPPWRFLRIRHDREDILKKKVYYGNSFQVADLNALNFQDPFPIEMLSQPPTSSYFLGLKSAIYNGSTRFMSLAKKMSIERLSGVSWVVDLGIGRGSDIRFYNNAGIHNLVGVDNDTQALSETVLRTYSSKRVAKTAKLYLMHGDFTNNHKGLVQRVKILNGFPAAGAGGVLCHLAMHYACGTTAQITNFAKLCKNLVSVEGKVILTVMEGKKVFNKLKKTTQWQVVENGIVKYSIKRQFPGNSITSSGQKIGVLLPFSKGEHYIEYMVDLTTVIPMFRKEGMILKDVQPVMSEPVKRLFGETFPNDTITEGDVEWLELFQILVFERNN